MHSRSNDYQYTRDTRNKGALLNTDTQALEAYRATRKRFEKLNSVEELEKRVATLETLVATLLEKLS